MHFIHENSNENFQLLESCRIPKTKGLGNKRQENFTHCCVLISITANA
jgi:hypothetical protein